MTACLHIAGPELLISPNSHAERALCARSGHLRSGPTQTDEPMHCYGKYTKQAGTKKIVVPGLMPEAIRPIIKSSFTRDMLRPRPLRFFWLPFGSHFFAFCSACWLAERYFFMLKRYLAPLLEPVHLP